MGVKQETTEIVGVYLETTEIVGVKQETTVIVGVKQETTVIVGVKQETTEIVGVYLETIEFVCFDFTLGLLPWERYLFCFLIYVTFRSSSDLLNNQSRTVQVRY